MNKILKIYIAHQGSVQNILHKINENSIVVAGGYDADEFKDGILKLKCDDSYCGLPDKITSAFKFIASSPAFSEFTHFYKLDEDMEFVKEVDSPLADYMGVFSPKEHVNRNHHRGRCPGHYWNDKPYEGEVDGWCDGGSGYILSRKAIECFKDVDGTKFPLEDVMVCHVLATNGIYAIDTYITRWYKPPNYTTPIKTYIDLKGRKWEGNGIPKWIFRTGTSTIDNLPRQIINLYTAIQWNNPEYETFYFSDEDCVQFIMEEWGQEYLDLYNKLIPSAYKADFWRYLVLYKYGGCYNDFTQVLNVPYNDVIAGVDRVVVRDDPSGQKGYLYNALMFTKAGDVMVKKAIDICIYNIKKEYYGLDCLSVTGPAVLGQAFKQAGLNKTKMVYNITAGEYNGSRVLIHKWDGARIVNLQDHRIATTKIPDIHFATLYSTQKHYGAHYAEGTVFAK